MRHLVYIILFLSAQIGNTQELKIKSLDELINAEEPRWLLVSEWIKDAKNHVEVLPRNKKSAESLLYQTQVTTRSPMGAIIYETGGILIDHGWIRILGSGSDKLNRNLPDWNKGKSYSKVGEAMPFLLIADDAIGGFFAINGGAFGNQDLGSIYYASPDNLEWEPLDPGYSDFVRWTLNGNINQFYENLRWRNWKKEIRNMSADRAMNFYPFLWTEYERY